MRKLVHHAALDFLPGHLVLVYLVTTLRLQPLAPLTYSALLIRIYVSLHIPVLAFDDFFFCGICPNVWQILL